MLRTTRTDICNSTAVVLDFEKGWLGFKHVSMRYVVTAVHYYYISLGCCMPLMYFMGVVRNQLNTMSFMHGPSRNEGSNRPPD